MQAMFRKATLFLALVLTQHRLIAQYDSTFQFKISGYLESYYLYDTYQPDNHESNTEIFFNYHRSGELQLNLALVRGALKANRLRSNFGLMHGTYTDKNLSHEPVALRNIYEANAGFALDKQERIWLDAGVFESHLGAETPIGSQNPTLSRSMFAESSPYYLAGVKLSYQSANEKWKASVMQLNGWQKMYRTPYYSPFNFGTQIQWLPGKNLLLNHSTFIGSDQPDSLNKMRFFNDFYITWKWREKWKFNALFDIGIEHNINDMWFTGCVSVQHQFKPKWSWTLRAEYFDDSREMIIQSPPQVDGFSAYATSINLDYKIIKQVLFRMESKFLGSKEFIFKKNEHELSNGALLFYTSLCILLD